MASFKMVKWQNKQSKFGCRNERINHFLPGNFKLFLIDFKIATKTKMEKKKMERNGIGIRIGTTLKNNGNWKLLRQNGEILFRPNVSTSSIQSNIFKKNKF